MDRAAAVALLARAPVVHIASTGPDGAPIARTVHAVTVGDMIAFHGAPAGEKLEAIGRPAVLWAEETVASLPSYFMDPERACPASTLYRSVQVHGTIERVDDPGAKAAVLQALMEKLQPEGGYVPIEASGPLYEKAVASILVLAVSLERMDGKAKLAQNRTPAEVARILEKLWGRGLPGDARAVDLVRAANPSAPRPAFLAAPEGAELVCAPGAEDVGAAVRLVRDEYWNVGFSPELLAASHLGSSAWVGARDAGGALIATARAVSDGAKRAWIYDVAVDRAWRGRGLGDAVMRLLLDHPAVRNAASVKLNTRDAQGFYARMGFLDVVEAPPRPFTSTEMVLLRG